MTGKPSMLLVRVLAWPFPPQAIGWALLALCLTVTGMAIAQVHSFSGVVVAGIAAALGTFVLRARGGRRPHAR